MRASWIAAIALLAIAGCHSKRPADPVEAAQSPEPPADTASAPEAESAAEPSPSAPVAEAPSATPQASTGAPSILDFVPPPSPPLNIPPPPSDDAPNILDFVPPDQRMKPEPPAPEAAEETSPTPVSPPNAATEQAAPSEPQPAPAPTIVVNPSPVVSAGPVIVFAPQPEPQPPEVVVVPVPVPLAEPIVIPQPTELEPGIEAGPTITPHLIAQPHPAVPPEVGIMEGIPAGEVSPWVDPNAIAGGPVDTSGNIGAPVFGATPVPNGNNLVPRIIVSPNQIPHPIFSSHVYR